MTVHALHVDLRAVAPDYESVRVEITDRYGVTTRQMQHRDLPGMC